MTAIIFAASAGARADSPPPATGLSHTSPGLTELSLTGKEYYDDNVLLVSGLGLPEQSSWVSDLAFKAAFDFAPLLAQGPALGSATLAYQAERADYHALSTENYTAHRLNDLFKGKLGSFSYSLDNALIYVDGNKLAETYALNQLSGAGANQNDKYRDSLAHAAPRERRNQIQDRYNAQVRWDSAYLFFRPVSSLTYLNMNTCQFNTSKAPYLGYQDYVDRWDVNTGADLGYKVTPGFALTVGYRGGYQHQDPFSLGINSDQHGSSNHYQRLLFGFEGTLGRWLTVKAAAGPDYREFNPDTPITDLKTTRYYGEAQATATLSPTQSVNFTYKQWIFVSSTGLIPYQDIAYNLTYHWSAAKRLGFDLGARFLNHNYTLGDDLAGSAPSLRDDADYGGTLGTSWAFTPHVSATASYTCDKGRNILTGLAAPYQPNYRSFEHGIVAFGFKYAY